MRQITVQTMNNINISSGSQILSYVLDADRDIFLRVFAGPVAGNGTYTAYTTITRLGSGSAYEIQPRTAPSVASGVTAIGFTTIPIPMKNTDILKAYLIGLAGDTAVTAVTTEVWEQDYLRPLTAGQYNTSVNSSGSVQSANVASPVTISVGTGAGQIDLSSGSVPVHSLASGAIGDIVLSVWSAATRTLTSIADSSGVTTLLSRIASALTITSGSVPVSMNADKTGYSLTSAYDLAKTAAQAGDTMKVSVGTGAGQINISTGSVPVYDVSVSVSTSDIQAGMTAQGYTIARAGYLDVLNDVVDLSAVESGIWDYSTGSMTTPSSIGELLVTDVNATISSRSTYAGADTPGTGTLLTRVPSALSITSGSVYTANTVTGDVVVGSYASGQDPATLVLDVLASSHDIPNTIGEKINAAGAAADPLLNEVPGVYATGTAGYAIGKIGTGEISVVNPVLVGNLVTLVKGMDYKAADGYALDWIDSGAQWPDLTSGSVVFGCRKLTGDYHLEVTGSVVTPTGVNKKVRAEPTAAQTGSLAVGDYKYNVYITLTDGDKVILVPDSPLKIIPSYPVT